MAAPGERLGRYLLERRIASGESTEVHEARLEGSGGFVRACAIKLLLPGQAKVPAAHTRFVEEARLGATFSHPRLVYTFDAGEEGGIPWFAMELVTSPDLARLGADLARSNTPMPARATLEIASQVCEALALLHARDVIHRAVCPSNILVTPAGAKLGDFGLASTGHPRERGVPGYMAPEQLLGDRADGRTDLYAVGLVLLELWTGERAFDPAAGPAKIVAMPARISALLERARHVPAEARELAASLCALKPEGRPDVAESVALRLRAMAEALPLDGTVSTFLARPDLPEPDVDFEMPEDPMVADLIPDTFVVPASQPAPPPAPSPSPPPTRRGVVLPAGDPALDLLLRVARDGSTGRVQAHRADGSVKLHANNGKIVAVETAVDDLSLTRFLVERQICDAAAIQTAVERSSAYGGDLGGALVSLRLVHPHAYVQAYIDWSRNVVRALIEERNATCTFEAAPIDAPSIPLGLDRFGSIVRSARRVLERQELEVSLTGVLGLAPRPVAMRIPPLNEIGLDARELRTAESFDGTHTTAELVDSVRADGDQAMTMLRALFFCRATGAIEFGERINAPVPPRRVTAPAPPPPSAPAPAKAAPSAPPPPPPPAAPSPPSEPPAAQAKRGRREPPPDPRVLFRRANDFATVRKYDKAVECIEQAIAQAPQDPDLETFLHYYRFLHKRHTTLVNPSIAADAVLREFIESGKGSPRTPQGNLLLARLFRFAGRAETAAGFYAKALELDPECQEARKELATSPARATSLIPT